MTGTEEILPERAAIVLDIILSRRSVRRFDRGKEIPEGWLNAILEAGRWSPSAGNRQPWRFIVVTRAGTIIELGQASYGQGMFKESAIVIAVVALPDVSAERYGDRGRRMYCLQDTAAACQNMLLVIHSLGLGAVWVGAFNDEAVAKALALPGEERPVALIPLGFTVGDSRSTPRRLLEDEVSHME